MSDKPRRKSFEYRSSLRWTSERKGVLDFGEDKPSLQVATPVEFKGHPGIVSPEDMLVGAVSACTMTTFLSLAEREKLELSSYEAEAWGVISHDGELYRFTEGKVSISLAVQREEDRGKAEEIVHKAHELCFITNSVRFPVEVTVQVDVAPGAD